MIVEGGFGRIARTASTLADEALHRRSAELAQAHEAHGMQLEFLKQRLLELSLSVEHGFKGTSEVTITSSKMSQHFEELKASIDVGFSRIMETRGTSADEVQVLHRRSAQLAQAQDTHGIQLEFVKQRLLELKASIDDVSKSTSNSSMLTADVLGRVDAVSRSLDLGFGCLGELPTLTSDVLQRRILATMSSFVQEGFQQVQDSMVAKLSGLVKAEASQVSKSESALQRLLASSTDVSEDFASLRSHLEKHLAQSERMWQRLEELGMIFEGGSIGITRTPSHTVGARAWQLVAGRRRSKSSAGQLDGDVGADMECVEAFGLFAIGLFSASMAILGRSKAVSLSVDARFSGLQVVCRRALG
eukprot:CAMPEP_0176112124 /NCGR_PEP_ID=MMETSP0120_2-20121206/56308_1 /TAXON_ID=160619 /ORGANISM="Kryptoperidinium foliaceum, Strain CCMP 1326" /LENGTH=359 /DNA_ID=CAMNT_0017446349 /DNA_START=1 /DNA_END=1081 /DNA_ORIENTATION=+